MIETLGGRTGPELDLRAQFALAAPEQEIVRLISIIAGTPEDAIALLGTETYNRTKDFPALIAKVRVVWADALIKALKDE